MSDNLNNWDNTNYTSGAVASNNSINQNNQPQPDQQNAVTFEQPEIVANQPPVPTKLTPRIKQFLEKILLFFKEIYGKFLFLTLASKIISIAVILTIIGGATYFLLSASLSKDPEKALNRVIINMAKQSYFKYDGTFTLSIEKSYQNETFLKDYLTLDAKHLTYADEALSLFITKAKLAEITYPTDTTSHNPVYYETMPENNSATDPEPQTPGGTTSVVTGEGSNNSSSTGQNSSSQANFSTQGGVSSSSAKKTTSSAKKTQSSTGSGGLLNSDYLGWQEVSLPQNTTSSSSSSDSSSYSASDIYNSDNDISSIETTDYSKYDSSQISGFSVPIVFNGFYGKGGVNFSIQYLSGSGAERKVDVASEKKSLMTKSNFGSKSEKWIKYPQSQLKKESIFNSLFDKKAKIKISGQLSGEVKIDGDNCVKYHISSIDSAFVADNFGFSKQSVKSISGEAYVIKSSKLFKKLKLTIIANNEITPKIEADINFSDYGLKNNFSMPQ
jgi:hypothetical protein